ncbi:hypothetical protein J2W44_005655 [Priestia aryabhattai]|uniref:bacteriophage abortive infection AbiH family protein n=1 Tax=Priestia aryabhattai TaxID=412384 RepID=UPI0027E527D8|nr:bacteriophage abortive infection AbiH family protein [Priestia aryabhattai]MDP9726543.1 hypothetical protein [Priestia aryabhattai]
MSKLFIIGNGFDIAHNLKTSYDEFRKYLLSSNPEINMKDLIVPEKIYEPDGGVTYDEAEVLSMLFYLINEAECNTEKWSNIESSLGQLNFDGVFDWLDDVYDRDGDINYFKTAYRNEDIASDLLIPTTTIQQLFSDWINTLKVDLATPKIDFQNLIGEEDYFLTFNYTDTLQEVYGVAEDCICYIHGRQHCKIYFGHGNEELFTEDYVSTYIGTENTLRDIHIQLRKEVEEALEDNSDFFISLENAHIEEIYSYGFSFSKVDTIYLKEICNRINTEDITWYFNDHNAEKEHPKFKDVLRECGYKGSFGTFHISAK